MTSNNTEGEVVITGAISRFVYAQGASVVLGKRLVYVLTKLNRKTLHWLAPPNPYQQVLTAPLLRQVTSLLEGSQLRKHLAWCPICLE